MQYTGERFIPTDEPSLRRSAAEHLHRYYMIAPHLKGKTVLDAACGSGYGSQILSNHALRVVGLDISEEAIEYAAEHFSAPNIEFITASVTKLPFADCSFDAIVSFETIEHIAEQKAFLSEIKRLLKPDGILIMSTPNKDALPRGIADSHYHIREFCADEFAGFLAAFFTYVHMYTQELTSFSVISGTDTGCFEVLGGSAPENSPYIIAICGDGELLRLSPSLMRHDSLDCAQSRFCFDALNNESLLRGVYAGMNTATAYFSDGGDFSEARKITVQPRYSPESGAFFAEFPVSANTVRIQYNPCDSFLCMCRIDSINSGLSVSPANMESLGGYDIAFEPYPHYYITGDFTDIKSVRITGFLRVLTNRDFLSLLRDFLSLRGNNTERLLSAMSELESYKKQISELNHTLTIMAGNMDSLLKKLDDKDSALALQECEMNSLTALRDNLQMELDIARTELDTARQRESALRTALDIKETEYSSMHETLNGAVERSAALDAELKLCRDRLSICDETMTRTRRRIEVFEHHIAAQENDIQEKNYIISQIHNSNAWALVRRYYKIKDFFKGLNTSKRGTGKDLISVVIPTKNAGANFSLLMACLTAQKSIVPPDIIVVDSGSDDATTDIAAEFGARVINIPPHTFSHSHARNLGISKAQGEFTLLLTQDALPCSENFLRDTLDFMRQKNLAAASCLEFPRPGCDMMYAFLQWNHIRTLGYGGADYISFREPGDSTDPRLLRKKAGLSNVCCLIKTDIALKYKYHGAYAEDLELGLRLYKDGHRLGFMQSLRILHSHRRSASYYFKRAFADTLALSELLSASRHKEYTLHEVIGNILRCFSALGVIIPAVRLGEDIQYGLSDYRALVIRSFEYARGSNAEHASPELKDIALSELINEFRQYDNSSRPDTMLISLSGSAELALEYLTELHGLIDAEISRDFSNLLLHLFAMRAGEICAYFSLSHPDKYAETLAKVISVSEV